MNCESGGYSITVYGTGSSGFVTDSVTSGQSKTISLLRNSTVAILSAPDVGASTVMSSTLTELAGSGSPSKYLYVRKITGDGSVKISLGGPEY